MMKIKKTNTGDSSATSTSFVMIRIQFSSVFSSFISSMGGASESYMIPQQKTDHFRNNRQYHIGIIYFMLHVTCTRLFKDSKIEWTECSRVPFNVRSPDSEDADSPLCYFRLLFFRRLVPWLFILWHNYVILGINWLCIFLGILSLLIFYCLV